MTNVRSTKSGRRPPRPRLNVRENGEETSSINHAKKQEFSRRSMKLSLLDVTPKERINIYPKTFVIIRSVLLCVACVPPYM